MSDTIYMKERKLYNPILRLLLISWLCLLSFNSWSKSSGNLYEILKDLPAVTLLNKGNDYMKTGMPDSALVCYVIAAKRGNKDGSSKDELSAIVDAMCHASLLYQEVYWDIPSAFSYVLQAREIISTQHLHEQLPMVCLTEAYVNTPYSLMSNDSIQNKIVSLFKKTIYASLQEKNWHCLMLATLNLLIISTESDQFDDVKKEMDLVMKADIPASETHREYTLQMIRALEAYYDHDKKRCIDEMEKFYNLAGELKPWHHVLQGRIIAKELLYKSYLKFGDKEEALRQLQDCERLAASNHEDLHLLDIYSYYSDFYQKTGDQEAATKYKLKYLDMLNNKLNNAHLFDAQKMEFLFQLNKKNDQVKEAENHRVMMQRIFVIVLLFSVILLAVLVLLFLKYRQVSEQNKVLYQNVLNQLDGEAALQIDNDARSSRGKSQMTEAVHVTNEDNKQLMHRIAETLQNSSEVYQPDFSIERLAELVGSKRYIVSQLLSENGKNFYTLLGEYRIKEACRRMRDQENYGNYTLEAISRSVGYKSRTNFVANFKKVTGMTPSTFQHMSKAQQNGNLSAKAPSN